MRPQLNKGLKKLRVGVLALNWSITDLKCISSPQVPSTEKAMVCLHGQAWTDSSSSETLWTGAMLL